ncbi:ketosteroid isomerase-like protein [Psychromicrobium silvestre]|uniref:Ketosteroid isomerase-like protein n=1 Tax=Psychromicrobium silvestre TaxID=1645614 RepID=A0A7Y9LT69_9MICC|nr:nuclear transport factor 2 family protein [Psychromicrobium silvestre]NYE95144.1 ketosteroid isomerase-like protein [Psychromicrobium silvestre]
MDAPTAIRKICDAWIAGDNSRIAELFAEDGIFVDPLHERTLTGPADILTTNQPGVDALTEVTIELHHLLGTGDLALAEGRMSAKIVANGALMDFEFAMVAETRDGLISRLTEYFDTAPLH